VLPIKDNVPTRSFPVLTVALIAANVLVWILYEDAGQGQGFLASIDEGAYQPCEVEGSCDQIGDNWTTNIFTSMFMHGSWAHLLGNMLFLWIFGNNVEDTLGRIRFILFYVLGGLAGAYILLHPGGRVLTWIAPIFFVPIPAVVYLGLWFLFQLVEGGYSFTHPAAGGGVAYFAHIGGFVFGLLMIKFFQAGRPPPLRPAY
jgi:membrane associated rhomboid family serine protease